MDLARSPLLAALLFVNACAGGASDAPDEAPENPTGPDGTVVSPPGSAGTDASTSSPFVDAASPSDAAEIAPAADATSASDAAPLALDGDPPSVPDAAPPPLPPDAARPPPATEPPPAGFDPRRRIEGLPLLYHYAASSDARVETLAREALEGLGFNAGDPAGPRVEDRLFISRHLLAWIDETGFYGKMNGLWRLNGAEGDALDFVVRDAGRPVSFFVVGEHGDGAFPAGYPGAEHIEFPNRVPEPNDDPDCGASDWCNQYAHNEANDITDRDIPWWRACNAGAPSFAERFEPVEERLEADALRLVYEGPLVKEADGDGRHDGDACHADYLFADGVRRRVWLRVGYVLRRDTFDFDRLMQIRNPAENPAFDGPMSLIGGFVISGWPNAHATKRLDAWIRPELRDARDESHGTTLTGGRWNDHRVAAVDRDEIFAWMGQPVSLSVAPQHVTGRSVTLSHVGPSDNDDVGFCLCKVHGGFELGGGLIHGGISLPVGPGQSSIEALRRLALPPGEAPPPPRARVFEAERDLQHAVGRAEGDGWAAATGPDAEGHMAFGPYVRDLPDVPSRVTFRLMVDNHDADNLRVVTVDVYDTDADELLALRDVRRTEFAAPMTYQDVVLDVDLSGRAGHALETRVFWHDVSYVRLDRVEVTPR